MTRLMLDTSAYSAFKRGHPGVVRRLGEADEIFLCPVVLGELLAGFRRGSRRRVHEQELEEFLSADRVFVLPMDDDVAECYAAIVAHLLDAGTPLPTNDLWIAAAAMRMGLALLTLDADFDRIPQIRVQRLPPERPSRN